jgi:hypothetical protein
LDGLQDGFTAAASGRDNALTQRRTGAPGLRTPYELVVGLQKRAP